MAVTISNAYSEGRTVLKNLISSSVTDPKTGQTNSRRRWIFREFPDTTSRDYGQYPIIILESPDLEDSPVDLCGYTSDGQFTYSLAVYAEFNDSNARTDSISDELYAMFKSKTNIDTLATANLYEPKITSSPFSNTDEDNKKLSGRVFVITLNSTLEAA